MKYERTTPDRETNPPDDDRFEPCEHCNGTGQIMIPPDDDDEVKFPEYEKCTTCKGEGEVPRHDD